MGLITRVIGVVLTVILAIPIAEAARAFTAPLIGGAWMFVALAAIGFVFLKLVV